METGLGLEVWVEQAGDHSVVRVEGELDVATGPALAHALDEVLGRRNPDVILDVAGLRFADASALALFVSATRRARTAGGRLRLRNVTPLVARILAITRVGTVLDIEEEDGRGVTWTSTRHG